MGGSAKRRNRRAARAERRKAEFRESELREGLGSDVLMDPKTVATDLKIVKRSLRWGLTSTKRRGLVDRLCRIAGKEFTTRVNSDGDVIHDEELAEKNALEAIKILVTIGAQQQKDEHLERRLTHAPGNPHQKQTTINVGVNVDNRIDEQRAETLAIAKRIREGKILSGTSAGSD